MKKLIVVLLIGLMVVPIVASAEKTQVRWYVGLGAGSNTDTLEPQKKFVEKFNALHEDIELVIEIVANAQAFDVLATQIAGGNPPDVVGPVGIRGRDSFKGVWLDLQPLVDKTNYDLSDFDPALVDFYRIEGEGLLGLPFAIYPSFIFFNKSLFDEAGLPYPPQKFGEQYDGKEWDFDALKELAVQLTVDKNGKIPTEDGFDPQNISQFGFAFQWTDPRGIGTSFAPSTMVDENGKVVVSDAWVDAWKWVQDGLWKSYFYPNGTVSQSDYMGQGNLFNSGHIGMVACHLWYAGCCVNDLNKTTDWDIAVMPSYKGKVSAKLHADTFEIMKATKNPDAAFTVLTYMLGEGANDLANIYGAMPARISLQDSYFKQFGETKFPGKTINWQVVKDSTAYADNPNHESWIPSYQESANVIGEFWNKVATDPKLDLDAAVAQLKVDLQVKFDAATK